MEAIRTGGFLSCLAMIGTLVDNSFTNQLASSTRYFTVTKTILLLSEILSLDFAFWAISLAVNLTVKYVD
jgi:hypothetical protein